jgi:hypothetical protein
MTTKTWRFIALLLAALTMGMHFAHVLELQAKLQWGPELYLAVQTSLYGLFGSLGPVLEVGALIAVSILAYLVRHKRPVFIPTLASAVAIALALIVWLVVVMPANTQIGLWQASGVTPSDWTHWRDQWQFGQAAIFAIHLVGFSALLRSITMETPTA